MHVQCNSHCRFYMHVQLWWANAGADPGFQVRGGGALNENFWSISCEKSWFYAKQYIFSNFRGAPQGPPLKCTFAILHLNDCTCTLYLFCVSLYYYKCTIKFKPHVSLQVHCTYMPTISKNENGITEMLYLKLRHFFLKKKTLTTDNNINTIRQSYSLKLHVLTLSIHVYIVYKCSVFT
jgi:hypothetical protein